MNKTTELVVLCLRNLVDGLEHGLLEPERAVLKPYSIKLEWTEDADGETYILREAARAAFGERDRVTATADMAF